MNKTIPPATDRFIRPKKVGDITGLSLTTIWRLEKVGKFPKRRQVSPGAVGWPLSEILAWMVEAAYVGK